MKNKLLLSTLFFFVFLNSFSQEHKYMRLEPTKKGIEAGYKKQLGKVKSDIRRKDDVVYITFGKEKLKFELKDEFFTKTYVVYKYWDGKHYGHLRFYKDCTVEIYNMYYFLKLYS